MKKNSKTPAISDKSIAAILPKAAVDAAKSIVRIAKNAEASKPVPAPKKALDKKAEKPAKADKDILDIYSDLPKSKKGDTIKSLVGEVTKIRIGNSLFTKHDCTDAFNALVEKITEHFKSGGVGYKLSGATVYALVNGVHLIAAGKADFPA